ncbi:hypothetical protein X743_16230 [Mesorhizobium sp. LNHC252B00]|nr:hypothetical protein X743_16230 [Mesorhizobium sp. LNHC252B00]
MARNWPNGKVFIQPWPNPKDARNLDMSRKNVRYLAAARIVGLCSHLATPYATPLCP